MPVSPIVTVEKKAIESSKDASISVPPELIKKGIDRIKGAADVGDVMQIKLIAEELMSESDVVAPFCDKLVQLAEDFDLDGIQKFMLNLNNWIGLIGPSFPWIIALSSLLH